MSQLDHSEGARQTAVPLRALRVRVRPDRVEVLVAVAAKRYAQTDEMLAEECLRYVPTLGQHACRNEVGPLFAAVLKCTSTPHLLEHLVIDAQWSAEDNLLANVAFSYEDDLVALDALKHALEFLNGVLIRQRG